MVKKRRNYTAKSPDAASPAAANNAPNEEPIAASPFVKKKSLFQARPESATKKAAVGIFATIHHVLPIINDGEEVLGGEGFIIQLSGYGSKLASKPIYERHHPNNATFLNATKPAGRAFELHLDGVPVKVSAMSGKEYQVQVLVHLLDGEEPVTKEQLIQFFNATFVPAYMQLPEVRQNYRPSLSLDRPYVIHRAWNKVLSDHQFDDFFHFGIREETLIPDSITTLKAWATADKGNLYSLWVPGEIPEDIKTAWTLTNEHLLPADIPQPQVEVAQNLDADNLNLEAEALTQADVFIEDSDEE